ncbi:MAG: hypothetical protein EHM49_05960 [Deltaproteobacteria bacterium]|nr:MAG: hypothetical protein EHM49_05960 [Deltaproteobacteria bacterium]
MQIINLRKIERNPAERGGKIKAVFDIDFGHILVRGCKLIEGSNGLWAAMPSRTYLDKGQKKWESVVQIKDTKIMDVLTHGAREIYEKGDKEGERQEINK